MTNRFPRFFGYVFQSLKFVKKICIQIVWIGIGLLSSSSVLKRGEGCKGHESEPEWGCRVFQRRYLLRQRSWQRLVEMNLKSITKNPYFINTCVSAQENALKKMHLNNFKLRNMSNIKYASRGQKIRWGYTLYTSNESFGILHNSAPYTFVCSGYVERTTRVCATQNNVM